MKIPREVAHGTILEEIETYVAGRYYYLDSAAIPGETLRFVRESDNAYDPNAVMIFNRAGEMIGYLPYHLAAELAPDLDARAITLTGTLAHPSSGSDYDDGRPPLRLTIHAADPSIPLTPVPAREYRPSRPDASDYGDTDDGDLDYVAACQRDMELYAADDSPEYFDYDTE